MNRKYVFNSQSKTHIATSLVAISGALMSFLPTVREFVPPEYYGYIIIGIGVVFHVLRNVTTTPIDEK